MRKRTVAVNDRMQKRHRYTLSAPVGRGFDPEFQPQLTLAQMLKLVVQKNCEPGDLLCRKRQRQALLHWAYDSQEI